jgi:zinc/manganese transport system permease protein
VIQMLASAVDPHVGWNVVDDVRQVFDFPFMVNAFRAGTIVAVTAGLIGWFVVLRRQAFAGHALAVVGFPGGAAAVLVGLSAEIGFVASCLAGGLFMAWRPARASARPRDDAAVVGIVQAFALACGFLFLRLYEGNLGTVNALLFGSFLGVTRGDVVGLGAVALVALLALAVIGRPLLFASVDPDVAAARGVPVRAVSVVFVVILALAVAASVQITGALLVFALLVLPAAAAHAVTARPGPALALSVAIAVAVTWLGLGIAYYSPYPIGFWITTLAFASYLAARGSTALPLHRSAR